ncbi:hypothetical protein [Bacterioplanoides pacificum]|uniref:Uncharacterized protein n=1 Tax=Bacterioplanoides pacificum TaxID=1171596 RepID=A0ABV7VR37_9GAMM
MVLNYFSDKAKETAPADAPAPTWVSKKNASYAAWVYVEELKLEKIRYIKRHHKVSDYLVKKHYQIKGSDIASHLKINRSSLMNTSSFSSKFRQYLDETNTFLTKEKENKLKQAKNKPSRGSIRSSKEELVKANTELRKQLSTLQAQKTEELVHRTFDQLPLPIKKRLGID